MDSKCTAPLDFLMNEGCPYLVDGKYCSCPSMECEYSFEIDQYMTDDEEFECPEPYDYEDD